MNNKEGLEFKTPKYPLTLDETVRLMFCVVLDVAEYAVPVLLLPVLGDMVDIVGLGAGIFMFGWIGLVSALEFLPMADLFPVFIFIWILWYYMKKGKKKEAESRFKEKWK